MIEINIEYLELFGRWRIRIHDCIAIFVRDFYFPEYLTTVLVGLDCIKPTTLDVTVPQTQNSYCENSRHSSGMDIIEEPRGSHSFQPPVFSFFVPCKL